MAIVKSIKRLFKIKSNSKVLRQLSNIRQSKFSKSKTLKIQKTFESQCFKFLSNMIDLNWNSNVDRIRIM